MDIYLATLLMKSKVMQGHVEPCQRKLNKWDVIIPDKWDTAAEREASSMQCGDKYSAGDIGNLSGRPMLALNMFM